MFVIQTNLTALQVFKLVFNNIASEWLKLYTITLFSAMLPYNFLAQIIRELKFQNYNIGYSDGFQREFCSAVEWFSR